ncbi:MAG: hypothetical protein AUI12_17420 [Acidobacteria bacterium 13_2_20CM_2_57_6]|nr:MAG: hypothetical protein AUH16_06515 [Acidobacteria bacterium 13_2_20CM_57_7]OLB83080.1 MAG: hypothetical protein AUI12_17420 [Acidobacteria bacterium 13_2_20CM_2_57_6]PYT44267.1 MAG: hypothetical protein DMG45_04665 [Acidobacteriota bacterium]PYT47213.1 MAG: hypothetical protein DMG47_02375 [Acidobacteriota bacterium]
MIVVLVAQPWWVNLLVLIPPLAWFSWQRGGVPVTARQLAISGIFAAAFGFLEAVVVIYLRAAVGLLPGFQGTLSEVARMSGQYYVQSQAITQFPKSLLTLEVLREAATILMLLTVALLTSANSRARSAVFLWTFAIWDIAYYAALWATVRWPLSVRDPDVLFLIPVPWLSPVWFPLLVSALGIAAVLFARVSPPKS